MLVSAGIVLHAQALTGYFFRSPVFLALTHLITLGWITLTIMGAMFQLVPVVTEKALFSERVARAVYYLYLVGLVLLVRAFVSDTSAGMGAGIVSAAIVLFLSDIAVTMFRRAGQGPAVTGAVVPSGVHQGAVSGTGRADLAVWYVRAAMVFLLMTVVMGSLAAAGLHRHIVDNPLALLSMHMTIAGIGWVCFAVIGFSFRLVPMFVLSHGYDETYGWTSFAMLLTGLVLLVLHFTLELVVPGFWPDGTSWLGLAGAMAILAGIVGYTLQMRVIFRNRVRRQIEPALWFTICATAYFVIAGAALVWMFAFRYPIRLGSVTVIAGLFGFAGMYIIGMMHKIVPFLHWYNKYSSGIGTREVPMTRDMISGPLTWVQLFVFNAGMVLLASGILTGTGSVILVSGVLLFSGSLMFAWNMVNVLRT